MPRESLVRQLINLVRGEVTPRLPARDMTSSPYADERTEPPTLAELVQRAAGSGDLDAALPELPPAVADALRAIAAGERISTPLSPKEVSQLGHAIVVWDIPHYRCELPPFGPPFSAPKLAQDLNLPLETAQRIAAVVDWPIGFLAEDFRDFAGLSEEDLGRVLTYLGETYGTYPKGTRYAAP